jgi:radical SAM protein with 4Fe4S-binding SPASM domain
MNKTKNQMRLIYENIKAINKALQELSPQKSQDCTWQINYNDDDCQKCKHRNICESLRYCNANLKTLNTYID